MRSAIRLPSLAAAAALAFASAAAAQEYRPFTAVIDTVSDGEVAMDALQTLGAELSREEYVMLDLRLLLALGEAEADGPRVELVRAGAEPVSADCTGDIARLDVAGATLEFRTSDLYTHLILSARFGTEAPGVGYTVACTVTGEHAVLAISGRFYVSRVDIPTANDIQLVAVPPL